MEYVRPVGVVFGPKDPWAVFCFTPEPGFTVDPPILWDNGLLPDLDEPPHLWGGQDDAPYNDPGPASGATAPSAPRTGAPPTTPQSDATPQSAAVPNAPAVGTAEGAGTTTTGGR
ncbi:hypothetical protein QU668_10935 [Schaalia sp. HMT-877]|nr:hypothetical protein QU668_10935 [Schaalia sp. HMT-877]